MKDDTNIGYVRSQIEALAVWRLTTTLTTEEQARYEELCACEQRLLDGAPPANIQVMGRHLQPWPQ